MMYGLKVRVYGEKLPLTRGIIPWYTTSNSCITSTYYKNLEIPGSVSQSCQNLDLFSQVRNCALLVNRFYNKILDRDWFFAHLFSHVIDARSHGCPITGVRFELFVIGYL